MVSVTKKDIPELMNSRRIIVLIMKTPINLTKNYLPIIYHYLVFTNDIIIY